MNFPPKNSLDSELMLALSYISAEDRDVWIRVGMAIFDYFGEQGFKYWDSWSRTSEKYNHIAALASWRSFKSNRGITIGTLIKLATENGYQNKLSSLLI